MKLHFTKMHALCNDFILIDNRALGLKKISQLPKSLCDRRFGIGADQLLLLDNSKIANFKMRVFNADGTEAEMCGNGIRCLAKYVWDRKLETRNSKLETRKLSIETLAGVIRLQKAGKLIKVDMGEPILEPEKIPVRIDKQSEDEKIRRWEDKKSQPLNFSTSQLPALFRGQNFGLIVDYPLQIKDRKFKITCLSMGNPHAVIVVKNVGSIPLASYGPMIENHRIFPKKTNVEFIQILNRRNIKMRVWERGAGETMACGTGASAAGVASALLGLTHRKVTVHLPGGKLFIEWSTKDNHVYMAGPAEKVFEGKIEI
jgi:diaminopimelate epimerase